jgi:hypothetical protein
MVARICASYERDRDLCRDLSQEVWFAVWRALPAYRDGAVAAHAIGVGAYHAYARRRVRRFDQMRAQLTPRGDE